MLAGVARVAHGSGSPKGKWYFAAADLIMAECIEGCFFKLRKKEEQGKVTMHAANHGFDNGTARVAFTMRKPPVLSSTSRLFECGQSRPSFWLSCRIPAPENRATNPAGPRDRSQTATQARVEGDDRGY